MLDLLRKTLLAFDTDRWITIKPNGPANKGQPALIGEGGEVTFDGEDGWITMNGTPVKVDDKGDPVAGPSNVTGKASGGSAPGKSFADYQKQFSGDHYQAAQEFYKSELMGEPAKVSMGPLGKQDVHFTGRNLKRIRMNMEKDPLKAEAVQHLRSVLEQGKYLGKTDSYKERKDYDAFHHFQKQVEIGGKPMKMIVDVGHSPNGGYEFKAYNFMHSGAERYGEKVKHLKEAGLPAEDKKQVIHSSLVKKTHEPNKLPAFDKKIKPSSPRVNGDRIAFDRASQRRFDENGFLHVAVTPISKEAVNDYYGYEIPGWQKLGLDPNRIYKGYRPASELAKAAATFNGLPLLKEHVKISASDLKEELRAGNLGTSAKFVAPYLYNALIIQDVESIEGLNPKDGRGAKCELSSSYRYDPVFKPGVFQGQSYDFFMTNIRGNHVALVEEGRAGPDVVVADAKPITPRGRTMDLKALLEQLLAALSGGKAPVSPGADESTDMPPEEQPPAGDNDSEEPTEDGDDFAERLAAHVAAMEDKDLAARLAEAIEAVKTAGLSTDEDPGAEAEDEDAPGEKDAPAMDGKKKRPAYKTGPARIDKKTGNVVINMAMDANAVAAEIRDGFKAQIEAARDVKPLIGDIDPLAFDSAAGIYGKALELIGKPSKLTDPKALKELCALAADAKRGKNPYPVVSAVLANDSKGDADPNFANLDSIRKA